MDLQILENIVLIFHVLAALGIIGLVLMQQGKGADMGSGFGGGASNTVFGSGGAGNFLTRTTTTIDCDRLLRDQLRAGLLCQGAFGLSCRPRHSRAGPGGDDSIGRAGPARTGDSGSR